MKNLELESFGLLEMNHDEMLDTDGGGFFGALIGAVVAGVLYIAGNGGTINGQDATLEQCMIAGAIIGGIAIPI